MRVRELSNALYHLFILVVSFFIKLLDSFNLLLYLVDCDFIGQLDVLIRDKHPNGCWNDLRVPVMKIKNTYFSLIDRLELIEVY